MHFDVDLRKCVACAACTVACMDQNDIDIKNGEHPLRSMYQSESQADDGVWHVVYLSAACMHCADCVPMIRCPQGCFTRNGETGLVLLDTSACVRCGLCVHACSVSAVVRYQDGSIHKCDGCIERIKHGLKPACMHSCPTGALQLIGEKETIPELNSLYNHPEVMKNAQKWE